MPGIEGLLRGRVLADRYRIEEVIGRGGMGAVYQATDERLGRRVALKVITVAGGADADARERIRARFHREARAAAALPHHPNVVPVYDYGTDPDLGLDYLVMELLRGEDLASRLGRGDHFPLSTSIWILHEAARGVAVGHRSGLIHRDVKPGNIFLAQGDHPEDVQVRVLDFGIAKLMTEEDTLTQLTQDGRVPLSPTYASPEQLRGLSKLTPASDVFSLASVGFQLLTGERAFSDADRNRMSLGMAVPTPSPRTLNPAIPTGLDEAIRRALAYDPQDRFADAGEFASVLAQVRRELGDAPLPPYAPGAAAMPPPRRRATPVAEDRTEFLDEDDYTLLDPGVQQGAASPPPRPAAEPPPRSGPPPRQPLPPRRRYEEERSGMGWLVTTLVVLLLLGAGGFLAYVILEEGRTVDQVAAPEAPPEMPEITPEVSVEEPEEPTPMDAFLANQEGLRFYQRGDFPTALEQFRRAMQIEPENAEYRNNYALALLRLGLAEEAIPELQQVVRLDPQRARAYVNLGDAYLAAGDTLAAISSYERFLQLSDDPRDLGRVERRIRDLRAAQEAPAAEPPPLPVPDTLPHAPGAG